MGAVEKCHTKGDVPTFPSLNGSIHALGKQLRDGAGCLCPLRLKINVENVMASLFLNGGKGTVRVAMSLLRVASSDLARLNSHADVAYPWLDCT